MNEFGDIKYIRAKDVKLHEDYFVCSLEPVRAFGFERPFDCGEKITFVGTSLSKFVFHRQNDPGKRYMISPSSPAFADMKLVRELPANFIGATIMTKKLEEAINGPDRLERIIRINHFHAFKVVRPDAVVLLVNTA